MAKGIESRVSVLERAVERLGASLGKVTATLYGAKDAAPKKARKPRQPRKALGSGGSGGFGKDGLVAGAPGPDDPHYADAGKKRRGGKKAEPAAKKEAEAGAPSAGEEGA